ncbi:hypothetical protein RE943_38610 [Prescottella equi]|nr:hypothetical protein RE943_38610 [Prescottella equi]
MQKPLHGEVEIGPASPSEAQPINERSGISMSVDFLRATAEFLNSLVFGIGAGSVVPGVGGVFGSLANVISTS